MELKRIAYPNFSRGESFVDYVIFDGTMCVFTAVDRLGTSTINAAERIVKLIQEREGMSSLVFYDLQTERGYVGYKPGQYEFSKLTVVIEGSNIIVDRWEMRPLPGHVLAAFAEHIGPNPRIKRDF